MAETAPAVIRLSLPTVGALLDRNAPPEFPYIGPVVKEGVATFLENETRERRKAANVQLEFAFNQPPLSESEQSQVRDAVRSYFACSAEQVGREYRVNRVEGRASAWYAVPIVIATLAIAGVFYAFVAVQESSIALDFFSTFVYLVFISVVWVMLWDPIEKLLFVGFEIRVRREALLKLSKADVRFQFSSSG